MKILFLMHPHSEGHISIEPRRKEEQFDIKDKHLGKMYQRRRDVRVKVNVGYCQDARDLEAMRQVWDNLDFTMVNGWALDLVPKLLQRTFSWMGLDWFAGVCRSTMAPYYHFAGTCAMQRDDQHLDWVVDPQDLQLRDHQGLHLCDASVFPSMVSSPPALTCCALGYAFGKRLAMKNSNTLEKQM
jgi:choline dehydrogenase-like flavoprotein